MAAEAFPVMSSGELIAQRALLVAAGIRDVPPVEELGQGVQYDVVPWEAPKPATPPESAVAPVLAEAGDPLRVEAVLFPYRIELATPSAAQPEFTRSIPYTSGRRHVDPRYAETMRRSRRELTWLALGAANITFTTEDLLEFLDGRYRAVEPHMLLNRARAWWRGPLSILSQHLVSVDNGSVRANPRLQISASRRI